MNVKLEMNRILIIVCSEVLTLVLFLSCSSGLHLHDDAVHLDIDSLYIDEIETTDTLEHLPGIFYFCKAKNASDLPVDLLISKYPGDELPDNCFLLFGADTIQLNIDAQSKISIPAKGEKTFWLRTNTFDLIDLMEGRTSRSQGNEGTNQTDKIDFLRKVIKESILILQWNDQTIRARFDKNVVIKYRDPNNKTID